MRRPLRGAMGMPRRALGRGAQSKRLAPKNGDTTLAMRVRRVGARYRPRYASSTRKHEIASRAEKVSVVVADRVHATVAPVRAALTLHAGAATVRELLQQRPRAMFAAAVREVSERERIINPEAAAAGLIAHLGVLARSLGGGRSPRPPYAPDINACRHPGRGPWRRGGSMPIPLVWISVGAGVTWPRSAGVSLPSALTPFDRSSSTP